MDDRDERLPHHWTMDRRVNLAHILTTLALTGTMFAYLIRQEARLIILEEHRQAQVVRDQRQDSDFRDMKGDIAVIFRELRDEIRMLRDDINKSQRAPR